MQTLDDFLAELQPGSGNGMSDLIRSIAAVEAVHPNTFLNPELLPDALRVMKGRDKHYEKACHLALDLAEHNREIPKSVGFQAGLFVGYYNLPRKGNTVSSYGNPHPPVIPIANRAATVVAAMLDDPAAPKTLSATHRLVGEMLVGRIFESRSPRGRQAIDQMVMIVHADGKKGDIHPNNKAQAIQFIRERTAPNSSRAETLDRLAASITGLSRADHPASPQAQTLQRSASVISLLARRSPAPTPAR